MDAYAYCADRRDAKGQMSLFTKDTHFVVFMDARSEKRSMELNRREDLTPVFDELNKYEATTHFMGQSTVVLDGDRATGETYCIAHHVSASEVFGKIYFQNSASITQNAVGFKYNSICLSNKLDILISRSADSQEMGHVA